ncbi:response regulator transcription factor [Novosphingobium sp.]|uniref:response regulator transcription factor n=1 Tax=Novosphingobium sp. TaxID=1874826 RepID=UPI003D0CF38E
MRILIAEDDAEMATFIAVRLRELGHLVTIAADGAAALRLGEANAHDVIVLDRLLPVHDGLAVLRALRSSRVMVPVLLLTALGRIEDRVDGLDAGADDYLVKPFAFAELTARIQALSRRAPISDAPHTTLAWGPLQMDLIRRRVTRDDISILLQPREFELLEQLLRAEGRIVTRTMLLERIWEYHFDPQTNIVESHMSRLRTKLNENRDGDMIETVRGAGYRMRPPGPVA